MATFQYQSLDTSKNEVRLLFPIGRFKSEFNQPVLEEIRYSYRAIVTPDVIVTPDLSMDFELRTVSLDCKPVYTALSYVWGDPAKSKNITVNGSVFSVTNNLEVALRHLQYEDIEPAIWIDAVCINQDNEDEKSDQVPRMARIYSNARMVLVWLGPGTQDSNQVAAILHEFHRELVFKRRPEIVEGLKNHLMRSYSTSVGESHCCELLRVLEEITEAMRARAPNSSQIFHGRHDFAHCVSSSILERDWWYRVWIIQEYVLAQCCVLQIGLYRINESCACLMWIIMSCIRKREEGLYLSSKSLSSTQPWSQARYEKLFLLPNDLRINLKRRKQNFFDILVKAYCGDSKLIRCSDDRDRIFALSGLAEDYRSLGIETNYRKRTHEVFIDVAQCLIKSGETDILSLCHRPNPSSFESFPQPLDPYYDRFKLPSWAPDWSREIERPNIWVSNNRNSLFSASGNSCVRASFQTHNESRDQQSSSSMTLAGCLVDEVSEFRPSCYRNADFKTATINLRKEIQNICKISQKLGYNIYTAKQLQESVWRLPIWDHENINNTSQRRATYLSKARYDAVIHFALGKVAHESEKILADEFTRAGILRALWLLIEYVRLQAISCFHSINFIMSSERPVHKLVQWSLGLVSFLSQFEKFVFSYDELWMKALKRSSWYYASADTDHRTKLIMTKHGYIGFGPTNTQPGDAVVIFLGSRVPHVLRKRDNGQAGYVLVGDAFVYGIMDGEFMKEGQEYVDFEIF